MRVQSCRSISTSLGVFYFLCVFRVTWSKTMARTASGSRELAMLTATEKKLAECTELNEVIHLRNDAETIRDYAQKQRLGLRMQNYAARIKLQAERKLGQALGEMSLRGGDRKSNSHRESLIVLKDLGIDRNQSSRWQEEASISDEHFATYCNQAEIAGEEISSRGLRRFIRSVNSSRHPAVARRNGRKKEATLLLGDEQDVAPHPVGQLVAEMRERLSTLRRIFAGICARLTSHLEPIEKREIPRYLEELLSLVEEIEREHPSLGNREPGS
jgi:hypothetical protein